MVSKYKFVEPYYLLVVLIRNDYYQVEIAARIKETSERRIFSSQQRKFVTGGYYMYDTGFKNQVLPLAGESINNLFGPSIFINEYLR